MHVHVYPASQNSLWLITEVHMHIHLDQKTHRTFQEHFPQARSPVHTPSPYQRPMATIRAQRKGKPEKRDVSARVKQGTDGKHIARCVFALRRLSSRTRRWWTGSDRSTSTCRRPICSRSCTRPATSTPEISECRSSGKCALRVMNPPLTHKYASPTPKNHYD